MNHLPTVNAVVGMISMQDLFGAVVDSTKDLPNWITWPLAAAAAITSGLTLYKAFSLLPQDGALRELQFIKLAKECGLQEDEVQRRLHAVLSLKDARPAPFSIEGIFGWGLALLPLASVGTLAFVLFGNVATGTESAVAIARAVLALWACLTFLVTIPAGVMGLAILGKL